MTDNVNTLWITGYAPTGHRVSLTLAVDPTDLTASIARALTAINDAGIKAYELPALPEDGKTETITYAVLRKFTGNDSKAKTVIDFYPADEHLVNKSMHMYMDTPDMCRDFEAISGLAIDKMPVCQLKKALDRNEARDMGVLVAFKTPAVAEFEPNPDYNPEGKTPIERGARYRFVRWQGGAPAPSPTGNGNGNGASGDDDAWNKDTAKAWGEAAKAAGIENPLTVLGVEKLGDWNGGKKAAYAKLEAYKRAEHKRAAEITF